MYIHTYIHTYIQTNNMPIESMKCTSTCEAAAPCVAALGQAEE